MPLKLPPVKKEKLDRAMRQFDEKLRHRREWEGWEDNQAHRYAISENNRFYPAKKIVSLATGTPVGLFSGGQPTNGYLKRRGFTIVDLPRSSEAVLSFSIGQIYDRQTEIHDLFGGNRQSGISPSAQRPAIFIFTGESGEQYGYTDEFMDDGVFRYTGEGQIGPMRFTKGNLAVKNHAETGRSLHIFKAVGEKQGYEYLGEFSCASYETPMGLDKKRDMRPLIVFNLHPVGSEDFYARDRQSGEIDDEDGSLQNISIDEARNLALSSVIPPSSDPASARRTIYRRSRRIAEYVLRRSGGVCESCGDKAPFMKKNGAPYLEPHHVQRLSDGGLDHPSHIGAICPTCHREIHHGLHGETKNETLKFYVAQLERKLDRKAK
jgi:5-methylcytosine-specific restriction protein A